MFARAYIANRTSAEWHFGVPMIDGRISWTLPGPGRAHGSFGAAGPSAAPEYLVQIAAAALSAQLAPGFSPFRPSVVMAHGFNYDPSAETADDANPFATLYETRVDGEDWRIVSWPYGLGLLDEPEDQRLSVGLGWFSSRLFGDLPGRVLTMLSRGRFDTSFDDARIYAGWVARGLAALIIAAHKAAPQQPVRLVAHSLGAELAMLALHELNLWAAEPARYRDLLQIEQTEDFRPVGPHPFRAAPGDHRPTPGAAAALGAIDRVLLLNGCVGTAAAKAVAESLPPRVDRSFICVYTNEDTIVGNIAAMFDGARPRIGSDGGAGIDPSLWVPAALHDPALQARAQAQLGLTLQSRPRRHWAYAHSDNMRLCRMIMADGPQHAAAMRALRG